MGAGAGTTTSEAGTVAAGKTAAWVAIGEATAYVADEAATAGVKSSNWTPKIDKHYSGHSLEVAYVTPLIFWSAHDSVTSGSWQVVVQ